MTSTNPDKIPLPAVENILSDTTCPIVWNVNKQSFEFATKEQMTELIVATLIEKGYITEPTP
tara:strand:+ start:323 stop:508 length:186 start_codon:yes stop_codon:yes gene_type:complete